MSQESSYSAETVASVTQQEVAADLGLPVTTVMSPMAVGAQRVAELGEALSAAIGVLTRSIPVPDGADSLSVQPVLQDWVKVSALKHTFELDPRFHLLGRVVQREGGPQVRKALEAIDRAQIALDGGDVRSLGGFKEELRDALDALSSAARGAHRRLLASEQRVLAEVAAQSLQDLGYGLAVKERPDGLLVRGLRQDLSVAIRITPDVEVHIDTAGFEGQTCAAEVKRLEAAMAERGVHLTLKRRDMHGRKEGGGLMKACGEEKGWTFNPLGQPVSGRRRARKATAARRHQRAQ